MARGEAPRGGADLLSDGRRKYFSVKEVADYLGISRSYAYQLIEQGKMEGCRFGTTLRVSRDEILRLERDGSTRAAS